MKEGWSPSSKIFAGSYSAFIVVRIWIDSVRDDVEGEGLADIVVEGADFRVIGMLIVVESNR